MGDGVLAFFPRHPVKINCALWKRPFSTTWSAQVCWWMAMNLPGAKLRNLAWTFVSWLEPFLTGYPAGERRVAEKEVTDSGPL